MDATDSPCRGPGGQSNGRHAAGFLRQLFAVRTDLFDPSFGVRAGLFVVVPLFVGLAVGQVVFGVLVTLGTLNLFMIQAPRPALTPFPILSLGVATNAAAWALGTVVGTTSGPVEWGLIGVGVFAIMMAKRFRSFSPLALIAAVMFVVAAGLPGGLDEALPHGALIAVGGLWALAGVALALRARWVDRPLAGVRGPVTVVVPVDVTVTFSFAVAATVAVGLAAGVVLGLPRDYWVMLTVLVALRPELSDTLQYASMRVLGTIGGAAIGFGLALLVSNPWLLGGVVVVAAAGSFAVRAVNYTVFAVFITIFLIFLLNLAYLAGPSVAVDRVMDTAIGGGLALTTGAVLVLWKERRRIFRPFSEPDLPTHPV
jgi:Fusaric acid resistance protein-like